jgi:hypothetical protein
LVICCATAVGAERKGFTHAFRLVLLCQHAEDRMAKAISFILILAMAIQIIKPLGLPGLKRRKDFWRIAVFAFAVLTVIIFIRPE